MSYYRISHSKVEEAITLYNQGKIDSIALCATIKICHPFKYQYVIGWATESIQEKDVPDVLMVTEEEMDNQILIWFIKKNGILMLPALRNKQTNEVLTWDYAKSHDSLYFNYSLEGRSYNLGEDETHTEYEHGFITSKGKFLNRVEAGEFAYKTKQCQVNKPLYSGDAEQFSLRELEEGDAYYYYKNCVGITLPKGIIPITKTLIDLLIKGYNAQYERITEESERKITLKKLAHLNKYLS